MSLRVLGVVAACLSFGCASGGAWRGGTVCSCGVGPAERAGARSDASTPSPPVALATPVAGEATPGEGRDAEEGSQSEHVAGEEVAGEVAEAGGEEGEGEGGAKEAEVAVHHAPDQVSGLRSELLVESAHQAEVILGHGYAKLVVRRDVFNGGERHDQATFYLRLPEGAVAVGLRTLGTLHGRPHWFEGELLEAELAARRYQELTGIGGYYPKDPALLSWRHLGHLALQVFPCPPGETKSVEYTLLVPTRYENGRHRLSLPPLGTEERLATLTVRPEDPRDALYVHGRRANHGVTLQQRAGRRTDLAVAPAAAPLFVLRYAEREISRKQTLARLEIDARARLSVSPREARVVVVVDGSRSLRHEAPAVRAAVRGFLAALPPDARVEVVTFSRLAARSFGSLLGPEEARARWERLDLTAENGSDVERALVAADQILERETGRARRVLLVTDGLTRSTLRDDVDRHLGRSRALLHVAVPVEAGTALKRDVDLRFAAAAARTGGLGWKAHVEPSEKLPRLRATFEEWVRPVRLHDALAELGGERLNVGELAEGASFEWISLAPRVARAVALRGSLWATPISARALADPTHTRRWSALVFGTEHVHDIPERDMMALAMHGGAVSPVTSYLAIEPGVRPSTEGIDWSEGFGLGGVGFGAGGIARAASGGTTFDLAGWLADTLRRAWRDCGGTEPASVVIESTLDEVVDVETPELAVADRVPGRGECLREAAWDLELPETFRERFGRHAFRVSP